MELELFLISPEELWDLPDILPDATYHECELPSLEELIQLVLTGNEDSDT